MDAETIQKIKDEIARLTTTYGMDLLGGIAILILGWWVARIIRAILVKIMTKRGVEPTIAGFVRNLAFTTMMVFVFIAFLQKVGVATTSFVAVIGAAGLAIGLALQGSLANFASGFLLILFRPYKKGDFIEGGGTAGIVEEIQVFNTVLKTPDNKKVIVPNSKVTGDNIINYSVTGTRRMDLVVGIGYGDDIKKAKEVLKRIGEEDERTLKEPSPPEVMVSELGDSCVNLTLRLWVNTGDYWGVFFDNTEKIKLTFDAEGINIPFPQRDVHLFQAQG